VFFESPHRIAATLTDRAAAFGDDRRGVVCRELTKTHEETRRGGLLELARWAGDGLRGEITVVVEGASADKAPPATADLVEEVEALVAAGSSRRDAVDAVSGAHGLARRVVYDAVRPGGSG
jgi:16S rRNA (cytidine1402-2'-O)-methyltransferase